MPKVNRGGKRSAPQSAFTFQNAAGSATPQQAQDILQDLGNEDVVDYSDYMKLSDDEKADAMRQIFKNGVPDFLDDSDLQKFLYYTDIEGKPDVVSDSALDQMQGRSLYRTVHDEYDASQDVGYSAKQIYNQIATGEFTRVSGKGGSAYGKGIYFADDYTGSTVYGTGNPKKDLTMRAKFNSKARVVSYSQANRGVSQAMASGSKLGRVYRSLDSQSAASIWALNNGYNVIDAGSYKVVLDRRALSLSTHTTNATGASWH